MPARAIVALLALTALGTAAYWLTFFWGGDTVHAARDDVYMAFERAFPLADAWMAGAAGAAAVGVARHRPWAPLPGMIAGSSLVFLGLLDVLFGLEQGLYRRPSAAVAVEVAINVFCLTVGPLLLYWFWRSRS